MNPHFFTAPLGCCDISVCRGIDGWSFKGMNGDIEKVAEG